MGFSIIHTTVVVGVTTTPILPDRSNGGTSRNRIFALIYNQGPVAYHPRFGEDAVIAGTPPVASGGYAQINPGVEDDDWMQQAYNGIVSSGTVTLDVMEVIRT
jgi:hypothetical protein